MRKLTFNQSLRGRWLLLLFALLLLPSCLQAEDYGITIAGVQVTSDNASSITGANITSGTVSFDASTNTLTLNNVTMSGNVVSSIANLNVKLVGVSTFNIDNSNGDSEYYLFQSTITTATLTFSADQLGATLQGYGTSTSINYNVNLNYWFDVAYDNEAYWSSTTTQMDDRDYCQVSKPYVTVDGSAINEANKDNPDITGVSFDLTNNKLTLSGFQRENQSYNSYSLITSNIANLNVDIQGGLNYIYLNTKKTNQEITSRGFIYTGASGQESSLNVTVAEGSKLLLSWSGETATTNWLQDGFAQTNMSLDKTKMQEAGVLAEAGVPYDYQMTISNYTPPVSYGITVGGVEVTSENASDILSDDQVNAEKVSYNAQTNTLALNGVNISGYTSTNGCITTNRSALNIAISGNNTLDCSSDTCTTIRSTLQGGTALTFVKGGDHCSLTLKGGHAIRDFASVTVSSGLYWDDAYTYEMGTTNYGSGMSLRNPVGQETYSSEATNAFLNDAQPLGLTVGGVTVTTWNADNVFNDSHHSVSYDAKNHKLTLKGAGFIGGIIGDETIEELTVHLVGYNQIFGDNAIDLPETATLHFTTSSNFPGSLNMYGALPACTIDYQNGLSFNENENAITVEIPNTTIASFTGYVSYVNGDNGDDAYIYSGGVEFHATHAISTYNQSNNYGVVVSPKTNGTTCSMWTTNLDASQLKKVIVQYDWGTNTTNTNVTVQIRGLKQNESTYEYEYDGKTYSEAVSLTTADAISLSLTSAVTSEAVELYFSSDAEFSFMPLNFGFTFAESYGVEVGGTAVNELNYSDVLGDGKVSFDPENNILTLNGATINGGVFSGLEDGLTVHLQGTNIIDGGYESEDFNGDYAFSAEGGPTLTFTTDEATPGKLLMKNTYLNEWGNAEYYNGFSYPSFMNGLAEAENFGDKKTLVATAPVMTPADGIYWPGQQITITGRESGTIKYQDDYGHISETTYSAPFTLEEANNYKLSYWQDVLMDETTFSLNNSASVFIYNEPTFSPVANRYDVNPTTGLTITLTNLPTLPENSTYYPQLWYYLNEDSEHAIQYTSIAQTIQLLESAKVCVYILDQDTDKILRSPTVEAEYELVPMTQLNISYAQNSRQWASYYADEKSLETPEGLQANIVTAVAAEGVTVSPIDYIPQNVPILLKRTAQEVTEPIMAKAYQDEETADVSSNKLAGTAENKAVKNIEGNVYVLYNDGFTRATSGSIPAHRAYLVISDVDAGARLWIWDDEDATRISTVGRGFATTSETLYNLNGQRVSQPSKGLYISNGKKRIVK